MVDYKKLYFKHAREREERKKKMVVNSSQDGKKLSDYYVEEPKIKFKSKFMKNLMDKDRKE